ncbi:MAG: aldo/keto reductase [Lentisphaeria bacterium]|nr:aldo/keto reductase [Lentisphaeria bacterium]
MLTMESTRTLRDGVRIPLLGFGVFQIPAGGECRRSVLTALEAGYRHIDTAAGYRNEEDVGQALSLCGIPREEVFVTTKVSVRMLGQARESCEQSLAKLCTGYVDLLLIHWPDDTAMMEAWEIFQALRREGKVRSIGVSNFTRLRFEESFLRHTDVLPSVNQIELHPFWYRRGLVEYCEGKGIAIESYAPLARAQRFDHPVLRRIASDHGSSPAQVMIRWQLQHGWVVIPKSSHPERIRENAAVFDLALTADEMRALDTLNEDLMTISWRPAGYY